MRERREVILKRILDLRSVLVSTFSEIFVAKTLESQILNISVNYTSIQEDTGNGGYEFKGDLWLKRGKRRGLLVDVKFRKPCSNSGGYKSDERCIGIYTSSVFQEIGGLVDRNDVSLVILRLDRESWDLISEFLRGDKTYLETFIEFTNAMEQKGSRREIE